MNHPSWLPPLFNVSPWGHTTYDLLYQVFHADFIANKTHYRGTLVRVSEQKDEEKELTFWHITTRKDENQERLPDPRRCERLPWLNPMLHGCENRGLGSNGTAKSLKENYVSLIAQ